MIRLRIKELREDRDLTQRQVAELLFISRSTYSAYENGANSPPLEVLAQIAELHDTSVDYLLGLTDEQKPYPRRKSKK